MMKRLRHLLVPVLMAVLAPAAEASMAWSLNLLAGQHTAVGTVVISISDGMLRAEYRVTTPGWCLTSTHLYAADGPPSKNAPGQFPYRHENLGCVTDDAYVVPTPQPGVYVAAAADTRYDPSTVSPELGTSGTLQVIAGGTAYFTAATNIDGLGSSYPAWCVDLAHIIYIGQTYSVGVYATGETLVDRPDNLDLVFYIINQDYTALAPTAFDIQSAIWSLIDDQTPSFMSANAIAIRDEAFANGEGFVPGCNQFTGVFLAPENNAQHVMLQVPVACSVGEPREEGAWAVSSTFGTPFKRGWGMYFELVPAN